MSPHVHHEDTKVGIWWRRWAGSIALVAVIVVGVAGFIRVESEGNDRERQFCGLVLNSFHEKVDRIRKTEQFLATPDSQLPQSLIDLKLYIKNVSLPQNEKELAGEEKAIPGVCWKYAE